VSGHQFSRDAPTFAGPSRSASSGARAGRSLVTPPPPRRGSHASAADRLCRVSTDEQDLTAQRDALGALDVTAERTDVDPGLTGTNCARPGLREALAAFRPATPWSSPSWTAWRARCLTLAPSSPTPSTGMWHVNGASRPVAPHPEPEPRSRIELRDVTSRVVNSRPCNDPSGGAVGAGRPGPGRDAVRHEGRSTGRRRSRRMPDPPDPVPAPAGVGRPAHNVGAGLRTVSMVNWCR